MDTVENGDTQSKDQFGDNGVGSESRFLYVQMVFTVYYAAHGFAMGVFLLMVLWTGGGMLVGEFLQLPRLYATSHQLSQWAFPLFEPILGPDMWVAEGPLGAFVLCILGLWMGVIWLLLPSVGEPLTYPERPEYQALMGPALFTVLWLGVMMWSAVTAVTVLFWKHPQQLLVQELLGANLVFGSHPLWAIPGVLGVYWGWRDRKQLTGRQ